jgi:hypothetical protein
MDVRDAHPPHDAAYAREGPKIREALNLIPAPSGVALLLAPFLWRESQDGNL